MNFDNLKYLFLVARGENDSSGNLSRLDESHLYILGSEIKRRVVANTNEIKLLYSTLDLQSALTLAEALEISKEEITLTNLLEKANDITSLHDLIQELVAKEKTRTVITVSDQNIARDYAKYYTNQVYGTKLMTPKLEHTRAYRLDNEKKQWEHWQDMLHVTGMHQTYEIPRAGVHDINPPKTISGSVGSSRETVPVDPTNVVVFKKK